MYNEKMGKIPSRIFVTPNPSATFSSWIRNRAVTGYIRTRRIDRSASRTGRNLPLDFAALGSIIAPFWALIAFRVEGTTALLPL
jgi:hypothetical protein